MAYKPIASYGIIGDLHTIALVGSDGSIDFMCFPDFDFWDKELQCFVQYKGAKTVDAAALLMPLVKFIGPNDPRWRSTLRVIGQNLVEDSLVYRYNILKGADTGLRGGEGTFSVCSFWNVECLARAGDLQQARFYFEKTLSYANHLGLYSEELGMNGEQLGNFPQALTHLGLISAAYYLDQALERKATGASGGVRGG